MSNENEFVIIREFDAPLDLVFKIWSEAAHLSHWWGPKGFKMKVANLDFKPGGTFHYCLESSDGIEMWGLIGYRKIIIPELIEGIVSFSDENRGKIRHPLAPNWPLEILNIITFDEYDGKTKITLRSKPINANKEECDIFYNNFESMNQGFTGTYDQLEEYLKSI